MTYIRNFTVDGFADSGAIDAFARLRVSNPQTIFDSKQLVDNQPLIWNDTQTSGSGTTSTFNTNQASTTIAVSNTTAGTRVRQTKRRFNYQPGKSQLVFMTAVFGSAATGITRRIGMFDDNNGLFFEQTSAGMSVVRRTYTSGSAVDNAVAQASWNIDTMTGGGASGVNLDYTKTQIMFLDFEWLGVGRVRMGWVVDGIPHYCHEFLNANNLTLVYMSTPNLPLRYEIVNGGTGGALGLTHICSSVMSEGGQQEIGYPFSVTRGSTSLVTLNNANIFPLLALRLNSSYLGSSVKLLDFSVVCTSTAAFNFYLLLNPTVTGTALSYSAVTNSSLDAAVGATNATTVSGGTALKIGTAQQTNEGSVSGLVNSTFYLGSTIAGVSDQIVLAVQRLTGTTETFYGSINWQDLQ